MNQTPRHIPPNQHGPITRFIAAISDSASDGGTYLVGGRTVVAISIGVALLGALWVMSGLWVVPGLLALIPVGVIVALRAPFLVCLAFTLLTYFRLHEAYPFLEPFRLPLLSALGTLGILGLLVAMRRIELFTTREHRLFLAFAALAMLSIPFATNRPIAVDFFVDTYAKIIIMVFAISWMLRARREFAWTVFGILIAASLIAGKAIFNLTNGLELVEGTRVTIGASMDYVLGDPNDLAAILSFGLAYAMVVFLRRDAGFVLRFTALCIAAAVLWAILGTQSRGSLLGVMALMGVLAYDRVKSKTLLIVGGGLVALLIFVLAGVGDRATTTAIEGETFDASSQGRINAWIAAWRMAVSHPITGVGLDNFYVNYYFFTPEWDGRNHAVHSTWFAVLAELGFPGLIVFISMLVSAGLTNLRTRAAIFYIRRVAPPAYVAQEKWVLLAGEATHAALISFLVSGTFLTHAFTWPIYILMALGIALSRYFDTQMIEVQRAVKEREAHAPA